ncbi:MAG: TatD family hydrolase [Chloroflexota bacterium]
MLVDTHCHLNFDSFDGDREQVLARARQAGLARLLNPGVDLASSQAAVNLAGANPEVYAAVGVHPNDALSWNAATLDELRALARQPKVVAIGEIGLDYYRERAPHPLQAQVLEGQLALAAELGLPVVIHIRNASPEDRRASADALAMLSAWRAGLQQQSPALWARPGVLHSFSDGPEMARRAVESGFYLGISGPVTFRKALELQDVAAVVPLERLLIETDAPFLTPHPHRGQRNEPAYVRYVAEKIAQLRSLPLGEIERQTAQNAAQLFQW